jgi:heme exporter protein D
VTDHDAMRAARDRWLADPESAGTGKAFEAGWSARNEEVAALAVRVEVAEQAVNEHRLVLRRVLRAWEREERLPRKMYEWAKKLAAPSTPTGEATTEERTNELPGPDRR